MQSPNGDHVRMASLVWESQAGIFEQAPHAGGWRSGHMEPVIASSNTQRTLSVPDQPDTVESTADSSEPVSETFVATIVRLDQSAAERLFRVARL